MCRGKNVQQLGCGAGNVTHNALLLRNLLYHHTTSYSPALRRLPLSSLLPTMQARQGRQGCGQKRCLAERVHVCGGGGAGAVGGGGVCSGAGGPVPSGAAALR
jgi:hypothetical protein